MKHFSFLLGSGFSVPDGYPTTSKLNERLKKINAEDIHIYSDGTAWFLNGQTDPNSWLRRKEKLFVQRFLEFYNKVIIKGSEFNYENFYDFYSDLKKSSKLSNECKKFFADFRKESNLVYDHYNLLINFNETFNQLLAELLLVKWPPPTSWSRPYQPAYREYLELLDKLGNEFKVHIHSLNHDLLMEKFFSTDTLGEKISDGFEEIGSPFYGTHVNQNVKYTVRLKRFTNKFDKQYCFYKLHGSVDNYIFNFNNKEFIEIKIPYGVSLDRVIMEFTTAEGKFDYFENKTQVYPDFLSGTSAKILQYDRQLYYRPVFDHFKTNLLNSDFLIVIGYGFGDKKLNEYLIDAFLDEEKKRMIVIDIRKPNCELLNYKNVRFIEKSISDVTRSEIYEVMNK